MLQMAANFICLTKLILDIACLQWRNTFHLAIQEDTLRILELAFVCQHDISTLAILALHLSEGKLADRTFNIRLSAVYCVLPRKVREVLNLRVMWSRGALERLIRALPASFVEREVLDAFAILQHGEFGPDGLHPGGLSTLHRGEFSPERLHPGGEGLHPVGQGLHGHISGNVVIGSHTIVVGDKG